MATSFCPSATRGRPLSSYCYHRNRLIHGHQKALSHRAPSGTNGARDALGGSRPPISPSTRARPVTEGVVGCKRLRPRPFLARDHPIFFGQKVGDRAGCNFLSGRTRNGRPVVCRAQRKSPDGRGRPREWALDRGPSVPMHAWGAFGGGNADSHYRAKGRRRAKVSAPLSPAPKGEATMKFRLA